MKSKQFFVLGDIHGRKGYHLGDEAMFQAALDYMKELAPSYIPVVLSWNPEDVQEFYQVKTVSRYASSKRVKWVIVYLYYCFSVLVYQLTGKWMKLPVLPPNEPVRSLADSAFFLHTGSGSWHNYGDTWWILNILFYLMLANWLKVPVLIVSQSIGPFSRHSLWKRMVTALIKKTLSSKNIRLITVRNRIEPLTNVFCDDGSSNLPIQFSYDDAVWLGKENQSAIAECLHKSGIGGHPYGLVSLSQSLSEEELCFVASSLDQFLLSVPDTFCFFVPHLGPKDIQVHERVVEMMAHKDHCILMREFCSARLLRGLTGEARFILSSRYHGIVLGCAEGVPSIALFHDPVYLQKMKGVADLFPGVSVVLYDFSKNGKENLEKVLIEQSAKNKRIPDHTLDFPFVTSNRELIRSTLASLSIL